jgi:uncharacterized protein YllA (UPF0747 family)
MNGPRVLSRPLGASRLAAGAMAGSLPAAWYPAAPAGVAAWKAHANAVRQEYAKNDWHTALAPAFAASGAAAERLARSADGRGILVTTGQQPGLFGGPMYGWSKALSALAFADALEEATGILVAPVFWAATYDADFVEAAVTFVAHDGEVEELLSPDPAVKGQRLCDTPLGDVRDLLARLEGAAGAAVDPAVLEAVRSAYDPSRTVGGAYVQLLRAVLEPLGIAVLDAGHAAVVTAARAVNERALAKASETDRALAARESELRAAGFQPKVPHVKGLSLVFGVRDGVRRRIPIKEARGVPAGRLEPNVLLRPIVEREILPTAAYLAGPGELAYFAQVSAVAQALGTAQPVALPRWAGMIVEPHVARILERHGLNVDDLQDPHAADTRLARKQMPAGVEAALENYRAALDNANAALTAAVRADKSPLAPEPVLEGARRNIAHRLGRLERRLVAAVKHRERGLMHDLAVARASLFPLGKPQERTLNFLPFLARHGAPLLAAMRTAAVEHAARLMSGTRSG